VSNQQLKCKIDLPNYKLKRRTSRRRAR